MSGCTCSGCSAGIAVETPAEVFNPPGLDVIGHRVGTHGEFLATMLARLSAPAYPALTGLTVRTTDDPAIGLLDAAAVLADLLTFYTDRIAAEGYLRTATEEQSLALLGRLVGYLPRPGVSAGTYLAYTVDADPRQGHDLEVKIPRGARAQSVPGPGEEPQAFESMEDLNARWSWNDLKVRQRRPYQLGIDDLEDRQSIQVAGVATNLKPGDRMLFVFGSEAGKQKLEIVSAVDIDRDKDLTVIGKPLPALPELKALRTALRNQLDEIVGDTPPDIVKRSVIVQRFVDGVLKPLRLRAGENEHKDTGKEEKPGDLTTPPIFASILGEVLERLSEALEIAAHYTHIHEWLLELRDQLAALYEQARLLEPARPDHPAVSFDESLFSALALNSVPPEEGEPGPEPTSPAVLGLGALLGALRKPRTRPPGSSRQLRRDLGKLYGPGSDLGTRLLTALDPRLGESLYTAWRQLDLTAPLAVQELLAMRQVATPFAATAPLKAVANGDQTTYEEWELEVPQTLGITVFYDAPKPPPDPGPGPGPDVEAEPEKDTPSSANLLFTLDANAWQDQIGDLTKGSPLDFGPGQVKYGIDEHGVASFEFATHLPEHEVTVSKVAGGVVKLTITGGWGAPITADVGAGLGGSDFKVDTETGKFVFITWSRSPIAETETPSVEVQFFSTDRIPANLLTLDAVYEGVGVGSWVVVERPRKETDLPGDKDLNLVTARVTNVRTIAKQAFGISGKVTELTLDRDWLDDRDTRLSQLRDTTIYLRGEPLKLADEPILDEVAGTGIELAELYDGLDPGRWVLVTGDRTDIPGQPAGVRGTELAMIAGIKQDVDEFRPGDTVHTEITLASELSYRYRRETVHVFANVVRATHGAGRDEPIGSGDASRPGQSFLLRQGPLTWLASDDPLGAASTLEVRVDGVRWHEVDSFAGRGPAEEVYVTETAENESIRVIFGDGVRGARLPTGVENVRARYRVGLGKAGNVASGRITQLTTRPLGVSGVDNPLPATGGADRDDASLLRRNIPLRVTAFDRLVSVPDYEDFAKARAGIGRASARRLFNGTRQIVHLTVAGADDIVLEDDSDIVTTLRASLAAHGDNAGPAEVVVREAVLLVLSANIRVHPDHSWEIVEPAVRTALLNRFGFRSRELGQPAYLSEVLAAAQAVTGVDHVDVDVFAGVPGNITPVGLDRLAESLTEPRTVVPARSAEFDETVYQVAPAAGEDTETLTAIAAKHGITVAELLRLNPDITEVTPLRRGREVLVFRGVRPAQLALLSPAVPDTLILKEVLS
jgi:predicted phage baseplate assembly protein